MTRAYDGASRKAQAERTKGAILDAARRLFEREGFDATTIAAIARAAKCSSSAVYTAFASKAGILTAIVERTTFDDAFNRAVDAANAAGTPVERLRATARIARTIWSSQQRELEVLRGVGLVAPELAAWEAKVEELRYERQEWVVQRLQEAGALRPEISFKEARDRLWSLSCRDLYRQLVIGKGWKPVAYEAWLGDLLIRDLLAIPLK